MQSSETDVSPKKVVGIGASAGGLQALETLFDNLAPKSGMAFIVIQHLSPDFDSLMDQLLSRHTDMPVVMISDAVEVQANYIYLLPPGKEAIYSNGKLLLTERSTPSKLTFPIDEFFRSLAQNVGEDSVGVILSGTGTDGSRGIRDIHAASGTVIVQTPETAAFDGMPISACETGVVDLKLAAHEIARALTRISGDEESVLTGLDEHSDQPIDHMLPAMRSLFGLLHRKFGLNFSCYRSEMIARRIERRVKLTESASIAEFAELASRNAEELNRLYYDMLIGVTNFFRDPAVFDRLEKDLLPSLLESLVEGEEFRCWVAGVATGEEAYSIAMLLTKEFERRGREKKIRIFASDVHEPSLAVAGRGIYCEEELTGVSEELRKDFFIERHDGFHVAPELRKMVVFTPHDVIRDAPFTRLHLITCRNLLIYLTPHTQQRVLSLFHFGLKSEGALCLGTSESLGELRDGFRPVDESLRIFRKHREVDNAIVSNSLPGRRWQPLATTPATVRTRTFHQKLLSTYDTLLQRVISKAVLINASRQILHVFGGAGELLVFANGRLENDLQDVIHHSLKGPLSLALVQLKRHGGPVVVERVACELQGETKLVNLEVELIKDDLSDDLFADEEDILVRLDVDTSEQESAEETKLTISQVKTLENLERELQFSQDSLQSTIEELQSMNEEAQSTNEQLTASNEELQSTNEELHSVNEELYTVNAEHQRKIDELTELNDDIDNLLTSTNVHTLFLDSRLRLRRFTPRIADIFNLIPQDIGRPIDSFTHKLQESHLADLIKQVIQDEASVQKEVKDKSGQWYLMRIFPYLSRSAVEGAVLTLVDVTSLQAATEALKDSEERFYLAVRGSNAGIWDWKDVEEDDVWCSARMLTLLGMSSDTQMTMSGLQQLVHPQDRSRVSSALKKHLRDDAVFDIECRMEVEGSGGYRWMHIRGSAERVDGGRALRMAGSFEDVTDRHAAEEAVQLGVERRDQFLAMLSHELRNPLGAVQNATSLIANGQVDESIREKATAVVQRQLGQMSRLLDDLLDVSRITHGKIELRRSDVDLCEVVQEALMVVRATAELQGMIVTSELPDEPVVVHGDSARLEQVTVNLLVNAIKYTPDGGSIIVSLHRDGDQAVLEVKDSGVGIPKDKIKEIFSLFYQSDETLDRSSGGMGVGLTLVDAVVKMHGGTISCQSDGANCGSSFIVNLPAVARTAKPEATESIRPTNSLKTIVLVEDIDDAREMFAALLALRGYEVHQAADGAEGLGLIERIRPDAAIIDIGLPKLNGHQVARRIRANEELSKIPLVALTGYGQDSDRDEVQESGFDLHLVKPLDPLKLDRMLEHLSGADADCAPET